MKMKLCLKRKKGWLNRHKNKLPSSPVILKVLINDTDGEHTYLCEWKPREADSVAQPGYLGTAKVIEQKSRGIGFNVWNNNDAEFIYYRIVT